MIPSRWFVGAVAGLVFVTGGSLDAQTAQPFSLQGSLLYASVFGTAFEGLQNGAGVEAQLRYNPSALSFGVGFQLTSHGVDGVDKNAQLIGGFVEPRYVIATSSNVFAPYISSRIAVLQQRLTIGSVTGSASGVQLNLGGGLLFRLSSAVNFDAGATFGYIDFGKFQVRDESTGTVVEGKAGSGSNIVFRAGLAIGLGK